MSSMMVMGKKTVFLIILVLLVAGLPACSGCKENLNFFGDSPRKPVASGTFYPENPDELKAQVEKLLAEADDVTVSGNIVGIISPHAGYAYSGAVAAAAYRALEGKKYDTVIIIGTSHKYPFDGASIYNKGPYSTPLGEVPLDKKMIELIKSKSDMIVFDADAHKDEHSIEVELPFLQSILGSFKLVPIVIGDQNFKTCAVLAQAIVESTAGKDVLIVASTDLSHYHPREEAAVYDTLFKELLEKNDPVRLYDALNSGRCEACGGGAVVTLLLAANAMGYSTVTIAKTDDSGTETGDTASVVGYLSAIVSGEGVVDPQKDPAGVVELSPEEKSQLLKIARTTIEYGITGKKLPDFKVESESLKALSGAFVTLKKDSELRGCIGYTNRDMPLYLVIEKAAVGAAFHDPRFMPVTIEEMPNLSIEISVLSTLEPLLDPNDITIGTHGLVIKLGSYSGLLLPQVPVEQRWTRVEFLENVCLKAGLFSNSWKDPEAELFKFTATVFEETR